MGGIFKALSEKNMQPRILYPARLSFRIDGDMSIFQDQQKLKEFVTTKPALHEMLRGVYKSKKAPRVIQNRNLQSIETKTSQAHDIIKIRSLSNHSQCEWPKCSHKKPQGCRLDKKT